MRLFVLRRLSCIHIINLDLLPEGDRLICYVSESSFDFCFQRRRGMHVLSRLSLQLKATLTANKSRQPPLTPTIWAAIDQSITGISKAPWDLKSRCNYTSRSVSCRFAGLIFGHMDLVGTAQQVSNKLVSCKNRSPLLKFSLITFAVVKLTIRR